MRQCFTEPQYRALEKKQENRERPPKQHNTHCLRRQEMCLNESSSWLKLSLAASVSQCVWDVLLPVGTAILSPSFPLWLLPLKCCIYSVLFLKIYFKTFKRKRIDQYSFVHMMEETLHGGEAPNTTDVTIPICLSFFFRCTQWHSKRNFKGWFKLI